MSSDDVPSGLCDTVVAQCLSVTKFSAAHVEDSFTFVLMESLNNITACNVRVAELIGEDSVVFNSVGVSSHQSIEDHTDGSYTSCSAEAPVESSWEHVDMDMVEHIAQARDSFAASLLTLKKVKSSLGEWDDDQIDNVVCYAGSEIELHMLDKWKVLPSKLEGESDWLYMAACAAQCKLMCVICKDFARELQALDEIW